MIPYAYAAAYVAHLPSLSLTHTHTLSISLWLSLCVNRAGDGVGGVVT
jgi:hypothetical protein